MLLVYQNFYTDPARKSAVARVYERFRCRCVDDTDVFDQDQVEWIVTKTRYIDARFVGRFQSLRGIVVLGPESWMIGLGPDMKIAVHTLDECRGYEVAEHAIALSLAAIKKLHRVKLQKSFSVSAIRHLFSAPEASEAVGAHNWTDETTGTLYGKDVGIVGYGLIGREIHRRLSGFGARISYNHLSRYPPSVEDALQMTYRGLEELFAVCDVIFLQVGLTQATRNMVSGAILDKARRSLVLVNCGRAGVVERRALYKALRTRRIACYATDVFWREPVPYFDPFRRLRNCIITPHMAESLPDRKHDLIEKALAKITGEGEKLP